MPFFNFRTNSDPRHVHRAALVLSSQNHRIDGDSGIIVQTQPDVHGGTSNVPSMCFFVVYSCITSSFRTCFIKFART